MIRVSDIAQHSDYKATESLDALRQSEYPALDAQDHVYLDYTGAGLFARSQVRALLANRTNPISTATYERFKFGLDGLVLPCYGKGMRNRGREFARRERQRQITAEVAAETNTLKVKRLLAEAPPLFNKQVESFKAWLEGYNEVQPDDPQKRMSFSTLSPDSFRITKGLNNERIELIVCFHPNNAYFTCVSNPRGYGAVFCYDLDSDGKVTLYSGGKAMDCDTASDAVLRAFISRLWQSGD